MKLSTFLPLLATFTSVLADGANTEDAAKTDIGRIAYAPVIVRHATVRSKLSFDATKQALEDAIPQLTYTWHDKLQAGDIAGGKAALEALPPFNLFGPPVDHGLLLSIYGMRRRALLYEMGNPLTASKMTRYKLQSAIYGPVKVLLIEYEDGRVAFEWDTPDTTFGGFHDPDVAVVAEEAAARFVKALETAAGWQPQ